MTTYALIDLANTFFRARHVASRNTDPEEKVAMALHLTFASVNQAVRKYGIGHTVFCLEGRSFRRDMYAPYKRNRVVDAQSVTEADKAESEMFWQAYATFTDFLKEKTNVSVLRHSRAEADDMIARFIHLHPDDEHYIISTDTDYNQLITDKVKQYNGVTGELATLAGYFKESGKPVLDKKTKEPKLLEDPEYLLFRKCLRGDSSDNIFSAYPGCREVGSKNKVGIKEAYEDRHKQGFNFNNLMLQRWTDHDNVEHRVKDDYERNRALIDLTAQPEEIKQLVDQSIIESVRVPTKSQVGIHFMKLCGKYDLDKIAEQAETYAKWLGAEYTGKLRVSAE
jgi:5'-3' exonuclease